MNYYSKEKDAGQGRTGKHTIRNRPAVEALDYAYDDDDIAEQIQALRAFEAKKMKATAHEKRKQKLNVHHKYRDSSSSSHERLPNLNRDKKKRRHRSKVPPSSDMGNATEGRPRHKKPKGEVNVHQETTKMTQKSEEMSQKSEAFSAKHRYYRNKDRKQSKRALNSERSLEEKEYKMEKVKTLYGDQPRQGVNKLKLRRDGRKTEPRPRERTSMEDFQTSAPVIKPRSATIGRPTLYAPYASELQSTASSDHEDSAKFDGEKDKVKFSVTTHAWHAYIANYVIISLPHITEVFPFLQPL